jgi:hypothetical protein
VSLRDGSQTQLVWHTRENGKPVDYDREPARSAWQRAKAKILAWLPLDREL